MEKKSQEAGRERKTHEHELKNIPFIVVNWAMRDVGAVLRFSLILLTSAVTIGKIGSMLLSIPIAVLLTVKKQIKYFKLLFFR